MPQSIWKRSLLRKEYWRSITGRAANQSAALGPASYVLGGIVFSAVFFTSEFAEAVVTGPLHILCHVNYFWSIALASAAASINRDAKSVWSHGSKSKSLFNRLANFRYHWVYVSRIKSLEQGIQFSNDNFQFQNLFFKDVLKQDLSNFLNQPHQSPLKALVAQDTFLWPTLLVNKLVDKQNPHLSSGTSFEIDFKRKLSPADILSFYDWYRSQRLLLILISEFTRIEHIYDSTQYLKLNLIGQLDRLARGFQISVML